MLIKYRYQSNKNCKYALFTYSKTEFKIIVDIPSIIFIISTIDIDKFIDIIMNLLELM